MEFKNKIRILAVLVALPVMALAAIAVTIPEYNFVVAHGPIQQGHADIDCSGCHKPAIGTARQQIQANAKQLIGLRETGADFGYSAVTSETCLSCHERPNERHPIYRFNEPRFEEARVALNANSCLGCHTEHTNARAFVEPGFCAHCHEDLVLKNDPIDVAHVDLVRAENWESCLGCHDFHGNHPHKPQLLLDQAFDANAIKAYLENGASPFGNTKIYEAKEE